MAVTHSPIAPVEAWTRDQDETIMIAERGAVRNWTRKVSLVGAITLVVILNGVVAFPDIAAGQDVPTINVAPSCKSAAAGYAGLTQEFESCLRSEEAAREILVREWDKFTAADRSSCHRLTTTGTPGTYTELLTCLEMRRDARALPSQNEMRKELETNRPPRRSRSKEAPASPATER